ncbi:hypothetical protein [uncultured Kordia sp.]|nr:hypothetical protein [uncultured Kordia sp.]
MKTLKALKDHYEVAETLTAKITGGDLITAVQQNDGTGDMD